MLYNANRGEGSKAATPEMFAPSFFRAYLPQSGAGSPQRAGMSGIVAKMSEIA